jgi:HTH-type transcriptional regulator, transcriptional repressor of NAD biosynthesis genes
MAMEHAIPLKRVVVYGPESTGKSTLCKLLAGHYTTLFVPEYARDYIDRKGNVFGYEDMEPIALGQLEQEDQMASLAKKVLFCDTDLITTVIYARYFFDRCPDQVLKLANERSYDLYLMMDIDLAWEADPQRYSPDQREELRDLFRNELVLRGIHFVTVQGVGEARTQAAFEAVDALLNPSV